MLIKINCDSFALFNFLEFWGLFFWGTVPLVLIWTHFDLTVNDLWSIHEKFQPWTLLSHFDILFNHLWTVSYHFVTLLNHFGPAWAILGL